MVAEPHNTRLVAHEVQRMRASVNELLFSVTPANAIAGVMSRASSPLASSFERYAGLVLRDAGAKNLSRLAPRHTPLLSPPEDGRLARITCTSELSDDEQAVLIGVEDALNRLCCIADAIEDSGHAAQGEQRVGISFMGAGFLQNQAGYHSALVSLPSIGRAEKPDMAYFNEVDWRVLDHVAITAHSVFQSSVLPNMHQAFMGASGPDGSDWDVRTRLAAILESLETPLRYRYAFDVNIENQAAEISFVIPDSRSFPQKYANRTSGELRDTEEHLDDARIVHCMRLSCLLAAAVYGSSRHIERATITGFRADDLTRAFCISFNRKKYVYRTLTAIDTRKLSAPDLRFDTYGTAKLIDPSHLEFVSLDGTSEIAAFDGGVEGLRIPPHLDERKLPEFLLPLFHAQRICDIDTRHYHGPGAEFIDEARTDSLDSTIAAVAYLEQAIQDLERDTVPPDDEADARPLYCANPLSRAVVSLLDDEASVSAEAETFLRGEELEGSPGAIRYFRAPDALFHAHIGLSDLYERLGDTRGAEAEADRCIALAPTSASSYFRKSDILAQQNRFNEAANLLIAGLRYAVTPHDCALLYYHLALILWNIGRKSDAVAIHVYTASLSGEFAEKARKVVKNLRKRNESPVIVYASPRAAAREMVHARIPIAPSDATRTLVVKAAVGLSCANAPEACAPYAAALSTYFRDDRVIISACRSIISGCQL